jgi:hypothetical protein
MSIEGLLIGFVLFGFALLVSVSPLLRRDPKFNKEAAQFVRQRERALVYYERVLRNIRDLDEDHLLGKLDDESYTADRALWSERGVQVLRTLDKLNEGTAIVSDRADDAAIDRSIEDSVEAAIQTYRQSITKSE